MAPKSDKDTKSTTPKNTPAKITDAKPSSKSKKQLEDDDDDLDNGDEMDSKPSSKKSASKASGKKNRRAMMTTTMKPMRLMTIGKNLKKVTIGILISMNSTFPRVKERRLLEQVKRKRKKRMTLNWTKTLKNSISLTIKVVDLMMRKMMIFNYRPFYSEKNNCLFFHTTN